MSGTDKRLRVLWWAALVALGAAVVARNVLFLADVPPGLYVDEASIGYNAWTIAYYGVDEHGVHLPLFFQAFGEFKNPIYIYALVPFARFLPLTAAVERLPAAIFGSLTVLFVAWSAWRISRSRLITLFVMVLAALTPWLIQEGRVGFEVIAMVALLSAAFWCLADDERTSSRRFAAAGVLFALAIFAYTTARLEVLLFAVAFMLAYYPHWRRLPQWWLTLVPILAGYGVLAVWALRTPGGLTGRYAAISIGSDNAALPTVVVRFVYNYLSYFGPDFLFVSGDHNLRHNTGFSGMLLAISLPLLLLGLWACWRRRAQPFPRFVLLCVVLSPIAAALTQESIPHALRAADTLPLLLLIATFGLVGLRDLLGAAHRGWLRTAAVAIGLAMIAQAGLYGLDMYTKYPVRAAASFDTGVEPAIAAAASQAQGNAVYVSDSLTLPYIQAFFALLPAPPQQPTDDVATPGLRRLGITVVNPFNAEASAVPGDLLVLAGGDPQPAVPFDVIATETAPRNPLTPSSSPAVLVTVDRVR